MYFFSILQLFWVLWFSQILKRTVLYLFQSGSCSSACWARSLERTKCEPCSASTAKLRSALYSGIPTTTAKVRLQNTQTPLLSSLFRTLRYHREDLNSHLTQNTRLIRRSSRALSRSEYPIVFVYNPWSGYLNLVFFLELGRITLWEKILWLFYVRLSGQFFNCLEQFQSQLFILFWNQVFIIYSGLFLFH